MQSSLAIIVKPFAKLSAVSKAIVLLLLSSLLFASMGVIIRLVSHSVDNASIVFFRNLVGLCCVLPWYVYSKGLADLRTAHLAGHIWRSLVGLAGMYCFFYAIAHLPLSSAMVFTYSAPVFIPVIAWLLLKERITWVMASAAILGAIGVWLVASPQSGDFNPIVLVGVASSIFAATAFVSVRKLTFTEPALRIVFYFCAISTLVSALPMVWADHNYGIMQLAQLVLVGIIATVSQLCMSQAYSYAPAGLIGPVNYMAIVFASIWAAVLWHEYPSVKAVIGMLIILTALLLLLPNMGDWVKKQAKRIVQVVNHAN